MNKKGFTLVELLAVIAILAILILIAMPNIIEMFRQAQKNIFLDEVKVIYQQVTGEYVSEAFKGNKLIYINSNDDTALDLDNEKDLVYCVELDSKGNITSISVANKNFYIVNNTLKDASDLTIEQVITGDAPNGFCGSIQLAENSLYKVFVDEYDNGNGTIVKKYTGEHQDSVTRTGKYDIYHFYADNNNSTQASQVLNKNNVIFAEHCWQMVRTTDTGGVKLIYNGKALNSKCGRYRSGTRTIEVPSTYNDYGVHRLGYMYGEKYAPYSLNDVLTEINAIYISESFTPKLTYWYADEMKYENGVYSLVNPYKLDNLKGDSVHRKYTFASEDENYTSSTLKYIYCVNCRSGSNYQYTHNFINLSEGKNEKDYSILISSSINLNGSKYELTNYEKIYYEDIYKTYIIGKYICKDGGSACEEPFRIKTFSPNDTKQNFQIATDIIFSSDISYDGTKYTLLDTIDISKYFISTSIQSNYHYFCLEKHKSQCNEVGYIYGHNSPYDVASYPSYIYYIKLKPGDKNVSDALDNILKKNTNSSNVKRVIEDWFETNLIDYIDNIEDTIYCSDRSIKKLNGWNPNGGALKSNLLFSSDETTTSLSCTQETDKFSTKNDIAKLKYPIGIASVAEMNLLNNDEIRISNVRNQLGYALITPYSYTVMLGRLNYVHYTGIVNNRTSYADSSSSQEYRPMISLKEGIEYISGDGSETNPFIIE